MRVLHVTPLYWPSLGGGEQVAQALSERIVKDGHDATVITTDAATAERFWSAQAARVDEVDTMINGVRVIRAPVKPFRLGRLGLYVARGLAIRIFDPLKLQRFVRTIGGWMPRVSGFKSALERLPGEFDLVHGFNLSWESCLVDAYEFARARAYPYVVTPFMHTGEPGHRRVSRNYTMSHQRTALLGSERVIVQTPTESQAIEALGVDRSRLAEVGIGIDPAQVAGGDAERFHKRHSLRGPIVAFVGRVTHDKGATALVRAMWQLWEAGVDSECVIAGPVMPDFARFIRTQPADPRLRILGPISDAYKHDLLAAAVVIAVPSRAESFGIVYLEAWAYAKPVIGTQAGGAADVITDGVDGYLVPFDDPAALASRLCELITNRERAQIMGQAGRRKLFERYVWDMIYARTLAVYEDVMRTHQ
ncbi:MAG TPA: glycosyltransferase family 4 protein [Anaerolineae bacterium]|nr:glycosyltransferase family 4 protein [Anaerolineae bacterium]